MRNGIKWMALASFGAACLLVGTVVAQDGSGGGDEAPKGKPVMPPMPEWVKKTAEHRELAKYAGDWNAKTEWKMAPNAPAENGTGVAQIKMIFDGMFMEQMFESSMMGQPFQGRLLMGYDTIEKEFKSVWIDSMAPIWGAASGTKEGNKIVMTGMSPSHTPSGKKQKNMTKTWMVDADNWVFEMWMPGPDGKMFRMGRIEYTRAK